MKTDRQTPRLRYSANRTAGWLCCLLFLLAVCGCNASAVASPVETSPAGNGQPTAAAGPVQSEPTVEELGLIPPPTTEAPPPQQATPLAETQAAPTPDEPAPVCQTSADLQAIFVADLGLADGTAVPPDAPFRKVWRVRNNGSCAWPDGIELVPISGDAIPGPSRVQVLPAAPGHDIDIVVDLRAPTQSARYTSFWRLQAGGTQLFGAVLYLEIVVSVHANPPPIPTLPSPTATPPSLPPLPPTATSTLTQSPTPTGQPMNPSDSPCVAIDPRFGSLVDQLNQIEMRLPCATGPVSTHAGWLQAYWQEIDQSTPPLRLLSLVIARSDTRTIYVLDGRDPTAYRATAYAYQNTWTVGMPEKMPACAPLVAPPGYVDPTHGIGKIWCEESLWNTIGWPEEAPRPATLALQGGPANLLVEITTAVGLPYLVAIDLETRNATVYQTP
jgi:hypothetical protein